MYFSNERTSALNYGHFNEGGKSLEEWRAIINLEVSLMVRTLKEREIVASFWGTSTPLANY